MTKKLPGLDGVSKPVPSLGRAAAPTNGTHVSGEHRSRANRLAVEAARLVRKGRLSQGVALLKQSAELDPSAAATHHDLGVALLSTGKVEEAVKHLRAAIRLDPNLPSAQYNLGHALDSIGRQDEALVAFEASARLRPEYGPGQSRLGDVYLSRGRRSEATAIFRSLAAAASDPAEKRIAEARAREAEGEVDGALGILRELVCEDPANATAHLGLGRILAQAGELREAKGHYEQAATASPNLAIAWYGLATVHRFTQDDQALIARLNGCLSTPNLTPSERELTHFALGKAHDDIGRYEIAIRHFDMANKLRSRRPKFDMAVHARRVDRIIERSTGQSFAGRKGLRDPTPVMIVGMPRSGTTLIEQILSSHPKVAAGGEMNFWAMQDTPQADLLNGQEASDLAMAAKYVAALRQVSPTSARVTDKMPFNFGLVGVIHRMLPEATFIHCRRHPIDNCLSIFMTSFEAGIDFAGDRGLLVGFYRQYERLMDHWRRILPPDRFIEVQYEILVADPDPQTRRLVAACGLEWDDACLSPQDNKRQVSTASIWQVRQPIYKTSAERWRRYEPWLGELRQLDPEATKA